MISFKSRCEAIRNADRITRSVKSIYPHISVSKSCLQIDKHVERMFDSNKKFRLCDLKLKNSSKINNLRFKSKCGMDLYRDIIGRLKDNSIGNCYEEAFLCQIIGKINGIKNIYPAKIFFNRNSSGAKMQLDHVVSIISDKPLDKDINYSFKNKEAVVLDPWLGITEFAGDYFTKLRNNFSKFFSMLPDDRFDMYRLSKITKTPQEFRKAKKELFKPDFFVKIHDDEFLTKDDAQILKKEFPELIIR